MFWVRVHPVPVYMQLLLFRCYGGAPRRLRRQCGNFLLALCCGCLLFYHGAFINFLGMMIKICCPMCGGEGKISAPSLKQKIMDEKKKTAKNLWQQGYSIREIMKLMEYKSPRSITILLND